MKRKPQSFSSAKRVFNRDARRVHPFNSPRHTARGGIRL